MSSSPTSRYVSANGISIWVNILGMGTPLLLLHGGMGTATDNFHDHIPIFARHFRVIAPDSRGHGRTNNPGGMLSYRLMADDIAGLIRALGLSNPLVCGWSDGGQIALELAIHYPGLAAAYVAGGVYRTLTEQSISELNAVGFRAPGSIDLPLIEQSMPELISRARQIHSPQGLEYWKELLASISSLWLTPFDYRDEDLSSINAPVLFLLGDRDEFNPLEQVVEMYRLTPSSELAIVPNSDHSLRSDVRRFTDIALEFLMRHRPTALPEPV